MDIDQQQINTSSIERAFTVDNIDFSRLNMMDPREATKDQVMEELATLQDRFKELQAKEEEYNQNAALIPESDPNVSLINDEIMQIKERVEQYSKDRSASATQIKDIGERRTKVFTRCFDKIHATLKTIYAKLTQKEQNLNQGGTVELVLDDAHNPFEKSVHFYPCPPGKRACDISQLSGGEKTVAGLALMFAMAQVKLPPLILLDEIDAFLDASNATLITDFIREELKT